MKTSILLAATGAILAAAGPVLQERRIFTSMVVVEEWVTTTVTDRRFRGKATKFVAGGVRIRPTKSSSSSSSTSSETSTSTTVPEVTPAPVETPPVVPAPPVDIPAPAPPVIEVPTSKPPSNNAPAAPAAPAGDDYVSTLLYHHNVHRSNHSAPSLSWGDDLASYALTTAKKCVFEHDLTPGGGGYGQNLAMYGTTANAAAFGANKAGAQACSNFWYNGELDKFPSSEYGKASPNMGRFHDWGHFSQVVWAGTKQVGCASYLCPAGTIASMPSWYTVCNYKPAGNMGGAYGNNVKAPQGAPPVSA